MFQQMKRLSLRDRVEGNRQLIPLPSVLLLPPLTKLLHLSPRALVNDLGSRVKRACSVKIRDELQEWRAKKHHLSQAPLRIAFDSMEQFGRLLLENGDPDLDQSALSFSLKTITSYFQILSHLHLLHLSTSPLLPLRQLPSSIRSGKRRVLLRSNDLPVSRVLITVSEVMLVQRIRKLVKALCNSSSMILFPLLLISYLRALDLLVEERLQHLRLSSTMRAFTRRK